MFIGIDLGTSSVKAILIDEKQKIIEQSSNNLKLLNPKNGYYEQNPEDWFCSIIKCFRELKRGNSKEFSLFMF